MHLSKLDLKMRFIKQIINHATPSLLAFSKGVQPKTPHSKLILRVWGRLEEVMRREARTGCWNDRNFLNLLEATKHALIFLCENDQYYKRWLGLLLLFIAEEMRYAKSYFRYEDALNMTVRPIGLTLDEYFTHLEALFEFNYCGYLYALSRLAEGDLPRINEARQKKGYVDFSTSDPQAIVRMFFPNGDRGEFMMFLMERYEKHGEKKGKKQIKHS